MEGTIKISVSDNEIDAMHAEFLGIDPTPAPTPAPNPLNPLKNFDFGKDMPSEILERAGWKGGRIVNEPAPTTPTMPAPTTEEGEYENGNPTTFEITHKQYFRGVMQVELKFWGDNRVFANIPQEKEEAVKRANALHATREGSGIILSYMDTHATCTELKPEHILNK